MVITNAPQIQIISGAPHPEFIDRHLRRRGWLRSVVPSPSSSSSNSNPPPSLTEKNVTFPSAVAVTAAVSAIHMLQPGEKLVASGWFLPTLTGAHAFTVETSHKANTVVHFSKTPSLGCGPLLMLATMAAFDVHDSAAANLVMGASDDTTRCLTRYLTLDQAKTACSQ